MVEVNVDPEGQQVEILLSQRRGKAVIETRWLLHRAGIKGKHNVDIMSFAKNGDHSLPYALSILARVRKGVKDGNVQEALDEIRETLEAGKKFRFGGF